MTEPKINVTSGNYEIEYDIKDDTAVKELAIRGLELTTKANN